MARAVPARDDARDPSRDEARNELREALRDLDVDSLVGRARDGRAPSDAVPELITLGTGPIALAARTPQYLVIDIDDSREAWRALLATIETLADQGRLVDCWRMGERSMDPSRGLAGGPA